VAEVTVGIDIGTSSVKAVAADADGRVLARARVPHALGVGGADRLEHPVNQAWRRNVRRAWREVSAGLDVAAVNVAAMVPSLAAVNARGAALTPGLLYGDHRGAATVGASPAESGELVGFLRWCAQQAPDAAGYWPAQAVANHALCGVGAIDSVTAMTAVPLFDFTDWDPAVAADAGVRVDQLPRVVSGSEAAGRMDGPGGRGALVGGGTIDAFGEQLVAGADHDGDVLVICGNTLITWAVLPEWREVPGLWTVPHTAPGLSLIGGPSNAGGLFLDWAGRLLADVPRGTDPADVDDEAVPVFAPYVRGERSPLHDPARRAAVHDLHLGTGPAEVRRAAHEAAGFVVRHHLDLAGVHPTRLVATGGGIRSAGWMQALADATGVPVDVAAVAEGGALGAAYLARVTAGLEPSAADAGRWARTDRRIEPAAEPRDAIEARYRRFRALTDRSGA
jgi:xylulokinase